MIVKIKNRYKNDLNSTVINNVLILLNISVNYKINYEQGDGRCLVFEFNNKKYYVIVSREVADARNAFLAQYIPTVLEQYMKDDFAEKEIYIYLLDTSSKAKTPFILDTYRVAKTLKIDILNEADLKLSPIKPYNTFRDWKNAKQNRQSYNPGNQSSYAMEDQDGYLVYGKLYGANGKESTFLACQLAEIAKFENKKVNFIQVKEHGTESISQTDSYLLDKYNVNVSDGSIILENRSGVDKSTCRRQDEFKYNLLEKYGAKKCYLCDCDIESNIIASHIHRITDIDNSSLSSEEKRKQAVDGDNGFWLCANHDKLFEYGIITFDKHGNLIINTSIKEHQINFIKYITNVLKIKDKDFTQKLLNYLMIHNKRVNLAFN